MAQSKYKRVLLKISGESFCDKDGHGIDGDPVKTIAETICKVRKLGAQVAVVNGAGNFIRGQMFAAKSGIPRNTADYMGMLATIINACALQETLEQLGQPTRVLSAIEVSAICEKFIRRRALRHLERERVVILAGGTGNPFFTTDSAASLRAIEINAELMIKATKVKGIFSADPEKVKDAKFYSHLTYDEALDQRLNVMDSTALVLCRDNNLPMRVMNIFEQGAIMRLMQGEDIGSLIETRN